MGFVRELHHSLADPNLRTATHAQSLTFLQSLCNSKSLVNSDPAAILAVSPPVEALYSQYIVDFAPIFPIQPRPRLDLYAVLFIWHVYLVDSNSKPFDD